MVGVGFGGSAHVDALFRLRDVEVIGVLASSHDRSAEAAERLRVPRAYATLDDVVSDTEVDAVHNCTPNVTDADVTVAALRAGKHVLSEKPLAMDVEQARELASHAERGDVVTGVCFNYRHFPLVQRMRATIGSAQFGPVHLIRGASRTGSCSGMTGTGVANRRGAARPVPSVTSVRIGWTSRSTSRAFGWSA